MDSLEVEDIIRFLLYPTVNYERERVNTILEITKEKHEVRYRTVRYGTVRCVLQLRYKNLCTNLTHACVRTYIVRYDTELMKCSSPD